MQIANTSSFDGSIKMLSDMGLHDEKQRREDPHGRSLLPYKMSKVRLQLACMSCSSRSIVSCLSQATVINAQVITRR